MNKGKNSLIGALIIMVSVGLCVRAVRTIADLWHRQDIIKERQAELETKKIKNTALRENLAQMQQDTYVEKIARDTLGLVKEGEAIVILPNASTVGSGTGGSQSIPNWKKWWSLFF